MRRNITKQDLTEFIGLNPPIPWNDFYAELVYSSAGCGSFRIYINGEKTPFHGSDSSRVMAELVNYWAGAEIARLEQGGIESVREDVEKAGYYLSFGIETKSGTIYNLKKVVK